MPTYIVPLAQWLVSRLPGWQVWSVERRQNLLEDQSVLTLAKQGRASASAIFDYYLGWLGDKRITHHIALIPDARVAYAKDWGLNVAMQDLRVVIGAARRLGGKVVLSGHSLGGALVTAYATWNFRGRPGADDLAGLVFDDGASFGSPVSAAAARQALGALLKPSASPWGGVTGSGSGGPSIPTPLLGLFSTTGALSAVQQPNAPVPRRRHCDPARRAEAARTPHLPGAVRLQHRRGAPRRSATPGTSPSSPTKARGSRRAPWAASTGGTPPARSRRRSAGRRCWPGPPWPAPTGSSGTSPSV